MQRLRIFAVAFSLACGGGSSPDGTDAGNEEPQTHSLLEPGPYRAGFVQKSVTYTSPLTGGARTIPLRIWYPADPEAMADVVDYAVGELADQLGPLGELIELVGDALDAPPVAPTGPFPVVVYSHASASDGVFAHAYAEHLAEHGWIFVAPRHVGDSALDRLAGTEIDRVESLVLRAADVSASLDWMETAADDNGFAGAVDSSDALMAGHSRGGTTTLMIAGAGLDVDALASACEEDCEVLDDPAVVAALESSLDRRFTAFVTQAPAGVPDFAAGELAGIEAPVMLMTGDLDMTTPEAERAWDLLDGSDDVWIRLPFGAHLSFLSICEDLDPVLEFFLPSAVTDGCGPEFVRAQDAVDVLRGYVLAYGLRHALGDEAWDVALRPPSLDENVEITAR